MTIAHEEWRRRASTARLDGRAFIHGQRGPSLSGETFTSLNPATGKPLAEIARCDVRDVDAAVASARAAFQGGAWSGLAPAQRKAVLLRLAAAIDAHCEELALLEALEAGKPIGECMGTDIPETSACIRWHAEACDKRYDALAPTGRDAVAMITREPIGVVAAVLPWNFPAQMLAWKLGPALASGNSLVVKPSEHSSLSTLRIAELAFEVGVPAGVFNVVTGFGMPVGEALGRHRHVGLVAFTGSTQTGRRFLEYAAQSNLKRVIMECGGKNPQLVLPDVADLDTVAQHAVNAAFWNMGENCSAGSRLYVHASRKDALLEKILCVLGQWKLGDPLDPEVKLGALIDARQFDTVMGHIERAQAQGCRLVCGGRAALSESGGWFVEPTIFDGVSPDAAVAREEIFGPVLAIISYESVDEAIRMANDSPYGLAASLWTDNLDTAHRVAAQLDAGTVTVNCFGEGDLSTPFGGFKQSGFGGRDKSIYAHDQYCELKTTWIRLRPAA
ncbi:aldehyde dehydrogenase [Variovorax sp. LT1R16]|uniref:aldehyde dehydrogenase n=1 Tax=Variovorax sp. LT1R16 TaxID=3443728 RepID=UPI003F451433